MNVPEYREYLSALELTETALSNVIGAAAHSARRLRDARTELSRFTEKMTGRGTALAFGSIARHEASDESDLDLAVIYDPAQLEVATAVEWRAEIATALRALGFDVSNKTFKEPVSLPALRENIGGPHEKNETLTYRALILTESAWLVEAAWAEVVRTSIFDTYSRATRTRGKSLTSLANDLHRYYRTICVDYRWKVEEDGKGWALRNLKLRHSRKLWHLGNIVVHCAALEREDPDGYLAQALAWPPLRKVAEGLLALDALRVARPLFTAYDKFLALLSSKRVRGELADLAYDKQHDCTPFNALVSNARDLQAGASDILAELYKRENTRQHLERFVIL